MPRSNNPHDSLVKRIFGDREAAEAELRQVLPAALIERLDWKTLHVESGSFVDPELQHRISDLLYSICLKGSDGRIRIYVLMEHQSSPDVLMAARFLIYVGRLYEQHIRDNPRAKSVPLVIPVLLYQGPNGWTLPRRLSDLIDGPASAVYGGVGPVELEFLVDDLAQSAVGEQLTRDQLMRDRGLALAEMARTLLWLHHQPPAATESERAARLSVLRTVITQTGRGSAIEPFLFYFVAVFGPESPVRAILLDNASEETSQMYATIRDQWIADGKAKGIAEGKAKMLEQLLDTRGLPLTSELRARVMGCDDDLLLQRWFIRAVTASTLAEVFDT